MAELREFLSELATDPQRLGEFVQDPEGAMTTAELSDEDKDALSLRFNHEGFGDGHKAHG